MAGCYTVDDVRKRPIVWTATYSGTQWDTVANCLSGAYARDWIVTPQFFQRERRAAIILGYPGGYAILGEFEVSQTSDPTTQVTWKFIGSGAGANRDIDQQARERANKCATPA